MAASIETGDGQAERGDTRDPGQSVDHPRRAGGDRCPLRQPAETVVTDGPSPSPVGLVQHFGFEGRHVDAGRAVGQASLARQAQIECFVYLRRLPRLVDEVPVEHFLQRPGTPAGGVLLLAGREEGRAHHPTGAGVVGAALADPGAPVDGLREVAAVLEIAEGQALPDLPGRRDAEVDVDGARVDEHSGVEDVLRIEDRLHGPEQRERVGRVHQGQQFAPGAAVAVLPRHRPAVFGDEFACFEEEFAEQSGNLERDVETDVDASVGEVPVGIAGDVVSGEQFLEVAQPVADAVGGDGGVLPSRVCGQPLRTSRGQAGPLLPDTPQSGGPRLILDVKDVGRGCGLRECPRPVAHLVGVVAGQLDEQPRRTRREGRHRLRSAPVPDDVDDPRVEPLARGGPETEQSVRGVPGGDDVGIAEHDHRAYGGVGDQLHRRLGRDPERALAADEQFPDVESVLRQQMLEGVARHLPAEATEFGADCREIARDDPPQRVECRVLAGQRQRVPGAGEHLERDDVVGCAAVAERARPTRVVADHPADRAPVVGGRVGTEAQTVRCRGALQLGLHDTRLHPRGPGLGVDGEHPVQVTREVDDDAGPDGVARERGAGAAGGEGDALPPAHVEGRGDVVDRPGAHHGLWWDAIERGIGRVQRACGRVVADLPDARRAESAPDRGGGLHTQRC